MYGVTNIGYQTITDDIDDVGYIQKTFEDRDPDLRYIYNVKKDIQYSTIPSQYISNPSNEDMKPMSEHVQGGAGVFKDAINLLKRGIQVAGDIYSGEVATELKNTYGRYMNNNVNWRPGFPGERHMIDLDSGVTYNYLGPQTRLDERLKRGDPPLDAIDAVAKQHDIEYNQALTKKDIREADLKFISGIDSAEGNRTVKRIAKAAIQGKMKLEDLNMASPTDFTVIPNLVQDDKPTAMKMDDDRQAFVGKGKKKQDPAYKLRMKAKNMNKTNTKMSKILSLI